MQTLILSKKKITHTKKLISQQQLTNGAFLPVCVVNTFVHIFALSILLNGKTRRHLIPQFNNAILLSGSCPHTDITLCLIKRIRTYIARSRFDNTNDLTQFLSHSFHKIRCLFTCCFQCFYLTLFPIVRQILVLQLFSMILILRIILR